MIHAQLKCHLLFLKREWEKIMEASDATQLLSSDVLFLVFGYLGGRDLFNITTVSRRWYVLACEEILWVCFIQRKGFK